MSSFVFLEDEDGYSSDWHANSYKTRQMADIIGEICIFLPGVHKTAQRKMSVLENCSHSSLHSKTATDHVQIIQERKIELTTKD